MGSKRRIAKYILPIILANRTEGQWYVEPFCGGCNSINKVDGRRLAADNNKYLIALYKALQDGWTPKEYYSKEEYQTAKENMDICLPHLVGYLGFVCSFRGKVFNGYVGNNTQRKNGKIEHYQNEQRNNLLRDFQNEQRKLSDVKFIQSSYNELEIPPKSIIYCDPPYQGTTEYKTGTFDHEAFWQWCRDMKAKGHTIFISEYNAPNDFKCVWEMNVKDSLSNQVTHIKTEKLFTI